ncbi:hypothetical protein AK830_g12304 [Neonectria ditissima]|uniref:Aminoglycoside phosphotransferase domain-containing protein n=1 Tax=Neonectria ditissima TaxID=78410 RepID=A0A0P7B3M2_9HYPO|nr:hypothetical protein AK830_g12304 [Neonectria ditissima]
MANQNSFIPAAPMTEQERSAGIAHFRNQLWEARSSIEFVTKFLLGLSHGSACRVSPRSEWLGERFNVGVIVEVKERVIGAFRKVLFKCAVPAALGEDENPGSVEEKIRVDVGSYVYLKVHCPEIPVPRMHGFGFPNGHSFTEITETSTIERLSDRFGAVVDKLVSGALDGKLLAPFAPADCVYNLPFGFVIVDHIGPNEGRALSETWYLEAANLDLQRNLHGGIARMMLTLASLPQGKIGSYRYNDDSTVTLTSRPSLCVQAILEAEGTDRVMSLVDTHTDTPTFISDMIELQDRYVDAQTSDPNDGPSYGDDNDVMGAIRSVAHIFTTRELPNGPFCLQLPELDLNHVFVDSNWNITSIVDTEWMASLPMEMLEEPHWVTGSLAGSFHGNYTVTEARRMFMSVFAQCELFLGTRIGVSATRVMNRMSESRGICLYNTLMSPERSLDGSLVGILNPESSSSIATSQLYGANMSWVRDARAIEEMQVIDRQVYTHNATCMLNDLVTQAIQRGGFSNPPN